jgi:hypothetical protein
MANAISNITLCNVNITPTHQLDFANETAQTAYFYSHKVVNYPNCRYQPRTATIRIKAYVDDVQNCNYGYYTNTYNTTSKTFYFWIVSKNYISRGVTELTIQIDVFQTWLFTFNFKPCFVEREHVADDSFGANTLPEDFELGDYVTYMNHEVAELADVPCFIVALTDTSSGTIGGIYGATYSGFTLKYYSFGATDAINTLITDLCNQGKGDSIAFIFAFPKGLLDTTYSDGQVISSFAGTVRKRISVSYDDEIHNFAFNGRSYTPFNNKIYTYPYNMLVVKNSSGSNVVLKEELWQDKSTKLFDIASVLTQNPVVSITPLFYDGKEYAYDDSVTMDDYGLCSWNNDNYANWFAQHQHSINAQSTNATVSMQSKNTVANNNYENALSRRDTSAEKGALNTAIGTLTSLGRGNVMGAVANGVGGGVNTYLDYNQASQNAQNDLQNSNLLNTTDYENNIRSLVGSVQDAQIQPNTAKGSTSGCGLDMARQTATFWIQQVAIKPEYAAIIDMHWNMFGYKVNKVKLPQFNSRQKWNYLKTVNCSVFGELPHEDAQELNNIFNNGLTVWHSESELNLHEYYQANPYATT